jgi:VanZ family protein
VQSTKKLSFKKFVPGIIWFIVVVILTTMPAKDIPQSELFFKNFDKLVHIGIFGLLALLFCWPFYKTSVSTKKKIRYFIIIALLTSAFGYSIELIQRYWAEGRGYDLMDWLADSMGALAAFIFSRKVFIRN